MSGKIPLTSIPPLAFGSRYLNDVEARKLLEVLKMTDLALLLIEDAIEDEKIEITKSMLKDKISIEFISRHIGLDESTIRQVEKELTGK